MKFENGIHDISNDEYHSSEGYSRSALILMNKSPYHFWYQYLSGDYVQKEPTAAMVFGELVHTLCLEPHLYDERFVIAPKFDRRTKAGKEGWSAFEDAVGDLIVIKQEDYDKAQGMASSCGSNEYSKPLLDNALIEQSIFFIDQETGIQYKSRPDAFKGGIVTDLKTCQDASLRSFQSSALSYGYYLQAGLAFKALESIGIEMKKFCFQCIEKEEPYAVATYMLDDEAVQFGIEQFSFLSKKLANCLESNDWPSYGVASMSVPKYALIEGLQ